MANAEEDFSFPATTTDSPPRFIDSPPLWRCSPSASSTPSPTSRHEKPEKLKGKEVDEDEKNIILQSFQEFRASSINKRNNTSHEEEDEEEKMDMLWEDLNDEFSRSGSKMAQNSDISSPGKEVQISCVKALKLSKTNGHMISGKKPNILVFIKVLKKFFLMQNSHRTIKKRSW